MTPYISLATVTLYCMCVGLVGYLLGRRERAERKRRAGATKTIRADQAWISAIAEMARRHADPTLKVELTITPTRLHAKLLETARVATRPAKVRLAVDQVDQDEYRDVRRKFMATLPS